MKCVLLFILASAIAASAQAQRYDNFAATTTSASGIGNITQVIPNATITVFNAPAPGVSCAGGGCVAATTYTSNTGVTACGGGLPLTRPTSNVCLSTADSQGNFGFWAATGTYQYCVAATSFTTQCYNATIGTLNTKQLNNVFYVDGVTNTTLAACAAAARAVQGVCDDRGLNNGSRTETTKIDVTGTTVLLGHGTYTFTVAAGGCFSLGSVSQIIGAGGKSGSVIVNNSNADCMSASVATNGTRGIYLAGFDIRDGFGAGRNAGNGITIDGRTDEAEFTIDRVNVAGHMDGIRIYRSIKSDIRNTECQNNKANGFSVYELATSTNLMDTYAASNAGHGYYFDGGEQYITMQNTACDTNSLDCYHFDNIGGQSKHFTLNSPGSENNVGNQIWAKDIVGFTINSPKLATISGATKDNIHLEGAQGVVISAGEAFGATNCAMNVITSGTPITPKDIFVFGTNLVAGGGGAACTDTSGILNDPNGAVNRVQGSAWIFASASGAGFPRGLTPRRSNGSAGTADIWDGSGNHRLVLCGDANCPSANTVQLSNPLAAGSNPTLTGTGACATTTTQAGGSWSGKLTCTGTTGASTIVITPGITAPNGLYCSGSDTTSGHELSGAQSGISTTTCTLKFTSITANDVLSFGVNAF